MKIKKVMTALSVAALISVTGAGAAHAEGNNGTVKVAPYGEIDAIPNNQPHVGCTFELEWYGFDANVVSTVLFEEQAPTTDVGLTVAGDTTAQLDGDDASGAGTADGFDGDETYTLSFTGAPHPQQGYHVKLTVDTPESNGSTVKHKVFWVEGCEPATPTPTPTPTPTETPTQTVTPTQTATPTTPAAPAEVGGVTANAGGSNGNNGGNNGGVEVQGQQATAPQVKGQQQNQAPGATVAGQQAAAPQVAGQQQVEVPTAVNAGASSVAPADELLLPASLAALGALFAMLAFAARRRA